MNRKLLFTLQIVLFALAGAVLMTGSQGAGAAFPSSSGAALQTKQSQSGKQAPQAPVGTGFTYQGQLKDGGSPANGQFDLQFKLFDAASAGTQVASTVTAASQTVTGGLFTVVLDFGASAFGGQARWLEIAVRPAGGGTYTTLTPRQPLTAVPYAQSLATGSTGAVITGTLPGPALIVTNTSNTGLYGQSLSGTGYGVHGHNSSGGAGVYGSSSSGLGVYGESTTGYAGQFLCGSCTSIYARSNGSNGVYGISQAANTSGVRGENPSSGGYGVSGSSGNGTGVYGASTSQHGGVFTNNSTTGYAALAGVASGSPGYGIYGEGNSIGVWGSTPNGTGVRGATTGGYGVHGNSVGNGTGVLGETASTSNGAGVHGRALANNFGVRGEGGMGVYGTTVVNNGVGVRGDSPAGYGVQGVTTTGIGVYGSSNGTTSYGVYGRGGGNNAISIYGWGGTGVWAGYFGGDVRVEGFLYKAGGGFEIDHPTDPANKYLYHSFVESPDMKNIYDGNVTTDSNGEAVVNLPSWFEAANKDYRYQLTPLGQFAQAIIASEIKNNRFTIKTDKPNVKVSWQVTGIRSDPYAEAHRIPVEADKRGDERGKYLHPEVYGQPESKGIGYEGQQLMKQESPKPQEPKP